MDGIGQGLDRGDDDRVTGVDPQRIDVLHRADRDARVVGVAHDLVLDLAPADQAALDHDLADRAGPQPGPDTLAIGRLGLDDPAAGPAQGERRPDDGRQADLAQGRVGGVVALRGSRTPDDPRRGVWLAESVEEGPEQLAILGHLDGRERGPDEPHAVALEHAGPGQGDRQVERRLATQPGQEALGPFPGDDRLDGLDGERLEIDRVGDRGSVMIVAGFELTRIVRTPSARRARQAWVPA